jgi:putative heme iron utilization protein
MNEADNPSKAPFAPLKENTFDGLALARKLLRAIPVGALATLAKDSGYPFATLTSVATLPDGAPLLLLSGLAHHTRNLNADARVSLLLAESGKGDPLTHPRLTVVGRVSLLVDAKARSRARNRFLRRHPKAGLYADFADFGFWRLDPEGAHLNGGFARAADYAGADLLTPMAGAEELIEAEEGMLDEINARPKAFREALAAAAGEDKTSHWRASGLDPDGLDLLCGQAGARLSFARPARNPAQWLEMLAQAAG